MKTRWKWIAAISVVGIACFLVWSARSNPARGLVIQFLGYETNGVRNSAFWQMTNHSGIEARFCLTNGSQRAIAYDGSDATPHFEVEIRTNREWILAPINLFHFPANIGLSPAQSTYFTAPVPDLRQPMRLTIRYTTNAPIESHFTKFNVIVTSVGQPQRPPVSFALIKWRVLSWFRRKREDMSVSITIQE